MCHLLQNCCDIRIMDESKQCIFFKTFIKRAHWVRLYSFVIQTTIYYGSAVVRFFHSGSPTRSRPAVSDFASESNVCPAAALRYAITRCSAFACHVVML